jgi:hypothetical protein
MRKGFLIYEEMRKYFTIYEEAVSHISFCTRSLWISFYMRKFLFSFLSVCCAEVSLHIFTTISGQFYVRRAKMSRPHLFFSVHIEACSFHRLQGEGDWSSFESHWCCVQPAYLPNYNTVWTEAEFWDEIQSEEFSSLLFTVTSTALPWDFYFFKLMQPLTVFTV